MIRTPAGFGGEDRIKRYLDYYQPSYGVMMLSAGQFSPALLFAAGEQGAWYDPSDFSTMFQDSAGTTPVTAVEQPVGRILDKSGRNNTATQVTSASRPVLSARVNLLTYSEQFDNAVWNLDAILAFGSGSVANATTSPNGSVTADLIVPNTVSTFHRISFSTTPTVSGLSMTYSLYVKSSGYTKVAFRESATTGDFAAFLLSGAGSVLDKTASVTATITSVGDGWYFITANMVSAVTTIRYGLHILSPSYTTGSITGSWTPDGVSGVYIWGADLRVTNDGVGLPVYQRIAAATDYDTTGFPYYLRFDGTDDSLATASVDFSATDKMSVFSGVRKLSDAARGMVVELGTGVSASGAFSLNAPNSAANDISFRTAGTGTQAIATASGIAAPITRVLTGIGEIATDTCILRGNGVQIATSPADQGAGNYINGALYIGRRASTSLPFNGRLYSLIVRGAQSTATEISNTETWVNGKTMAY